MSTACGRPQVSEGGCAHVDARGQGEGRSKSYFLWTS